MSQRTIGTMLLVAGVLVLLLALTADVSGLGDAPGLGWKQITLAAFGVVIAVVGMARMAGRR